MHKEIRNLIKDSNMNEITHPTKPTTLVRKPSKAKTFFSHLRTAFVTALVFAIAILGLLYNMEKKAREMERDEYKKQIQELTEKANKTQERLETSVLTPGSQPNQ